MSKLDDMVTEYAKSCFGDINMWKDDKFKQQIKDLIQDLGKSLQTKDHFGQYIIIPAEFEKAVKEL